MSKIPKKVILNPVLAAPWKTQKKNCENPAAFMCPVGNGQKSVKTGVSAIKRTQNMNILTMRFPGLKKYQARAALTMSNNKLDKAIILLEVLNCYRRQTVKRNSDYAYLKNIHVNLLYDVQEHDPTLRNVRFESSFTSSETFNSGEGTSIEGTSPISTTCSEQDSDIYRGQRVGVIITKTTDGYKAKTFDQKYCDTDN